MVRLIGPLHSDGASKQLGKTLIYKTKKNRSFVTRYNKPGGNTAFDASPTQLNQRMLYNLIIARWQTMTDNERQAYTDEAKAKNLRMSGWNLFYKRAIKDLPTYLGLQAYWSFNRIVNGKILDLSGNENDGTLEPSYPADAPQLVNSINKKFGKAGSFDGINNYIDCGNDESLNITDAITVEAWVKIPPQSNEEIQAAVSLGNQTYPHFVPHYRTANKPLLYLSTGNYRYFSTNVADNSWHHMVFIVMGWGQYDIENNKLYIDSKEDTPLNTIEEALPIQPAGYAFIGLENFKGKIDEVRIYNRALLADEIKKHYKLIS